MAGWAAVGLERAGLLLYLVPPATSTFSSVEEVPDYVALATPLLVILIRNYKYISRTADYH